MTFNLFPISIMSEKSGDIESFPSLLQRSAYHHGVSVGVFLRHIAAARRAKYSSSRRMIRVPKSFTCDTFIRPTANNWLIVKEFGELTGNENVKKTMLWWLKYSLQKSRKGLFSQTYRWCPHCFEEMDLCAQERYIKLIWLFNEVNVCFKHNHPLISKCHVCGSHQSGFTNKYPIGFCVKCGEDLAISNHQTLDKQSSLSGGVLGGQTEKDWFEIIQRYYYFDSVESFKWLSQGYDLQKLIADVSCAAAPRITSHTVLRGVEQILENFYLKAQTKKLLNFHIEQIRRCGLGNLQQIRCIAYDIGVPLYNLLSGEIRQLSFLNMVGGSCSYEPSFLTQNKRIGRDHSKVLKNINNLVETSSPPLSLNELAAKANVSAGYIEYRFPELAKKIVSEHQRFAANQKVSEMMKAMGAAIKLKVSLGGQLPSKRYLFKFLRNETGVSKRNIETAIRQIYGGIGS